MKCSKCGQENKREAKFCTKCGNPLSAPAESAPTDNSNNNTKYIIIALIVVIIMLAGVIGYFALNNGSGVGDANSQGSADSNKVQSSDNSGDSSGDSSGGNSGSDSDSSKKTHEASSKSSSSSKSKSKKWVSIGSYSGSGSGSKTIKVPDGKIKVELSAYPILNYATNHLYVSGTNGESGGVDWGPRSDVETRSDSFQFTSKSEEEFTIDYYETVSWEVEFFRYQ